MFVRMVKTRTGKKTHCYLRVVESYRSNGRVRQRVLWNMGKWERVRPGLTGLVRSLSRFSGRQLLTIGEIRDRGVKEYGNVLLLKRLWEGSGFKKTLESGLGARANCIMAIVFHKLCQPTTYACGATALRSWLNRIYLPEAERLVRLGQGRLRKRLLNSMDSMGRLELASEGDPSGRPCTGRRCVVEVSPVSPRGKEYRGGYLVTLPLGSPPKADLSGCKVYTKKELKSLLKELKGTKGVLISRHSTLGGGGIAFLDRESIPYLAFLRNGRKARRRPRRRYLTFKYNGQTVCLRTNIARKTTPYKTKRAFKGLLEAEASIGHPLLAPFVPPTETYLKGYILVCILSYLLDKMFRERLCRHGIRLQPAEALDTLKEVRVVSNLLAGSAVSVLGGPDDKKRWDYLTGMTRTGRTLLRAFGIKRPRL